MTTIIFALKMAICLCVAVYVLGWHLAAVQACRQDARVRRRAEDEFNAVLGFCALLFIACAPLILLVTFVDWVDPALDTVISLEWVLVLFVVLAVACLKAKYCILALGGELLWGVVRWLFLDAPFGSLLRTLLDCVASGLPEGVRFGATAVSIVIVVVKALRARSVGEPAA